MKVCVLGGGHGSYAAVADLWSKGHAVSWWRRDSGTASRVRTRGSIERVDKDGSTEIPVNLQHGIRSVDDLADAIEGCALIVVPLPATVHEDLAARLAPLLCPDQVVYLPPGTFGSAIFANALRGRGAAGGIMVAETGTLPYLARKHGDYKVVVSGYATRLPTGVYPANRTTFALNILQQAYPGVIEQVEDVLSGALMNAGSVIHPPLIVLNAAALEHFPAWDIHNEGTTASVRQLTTALDQERIAVREALGYVAPHFPLADHYAVDGDEWMYGRNVHGKVTDSGDWREKIDLQSHRYMFEDLRLGLSFLVSVGKKVGVPTPVAASLLAIGSAITGQDLFATGRTLESLGLGDMGVEQIRTVLVSGFE